MSHSRDLSNNRLDIIPSDAFEKLNQLSTLILSFNKIKCVRPYALKGLNQLKILSLHANDISVLPQTAFEGLRNITHMLVKLFIELSIFNNK